jgi:hypothetical protein
MVAALAMHGRGAAPMATAVGLGLGLAAGTLAVAWTSPELAPPQARIPPRRVVFDQRLSRLELPHVLTPSDRQDAVAMDTFLVAAQRLGYLPIAGGEALADLRPEDTLVVVHPARAPGREEAAALEAFVRGGGSLLVVEGLLGSHGGAPALLAPFGLGVEVQAEHIELSVPAATPAVAGAAPQASQGAVLGASRPVLVVTGGAPVLVDGGGRPLLSEALFGRGRVAVLVDSMTVSKAELGSRFTGDPTPVQRRNHETAYVVLRRAVERGSMP